MENEIELKIMLLPKNIPILENWLNDQNDSSVCQMLGNTYYDTPNLYFAQRKMGLRVRQKNKSFEMTLKMKGEIIGGLHIRPEYNLPLLSAKPDLERLVLINNLQIADANMIQQNLVVAFSTDFTRKTWIIDFNQSQIEVALDQGVIKNQQGQESICELEFELKQGNLTDLFMFLDMLPKVDGMWLSSLSKAQRGYLIGYPERIIKEWEKLSGCNIDLFSDRKIYQYEQQLADFIRMDIDKVYVNLWHETLKGIKLAHDSLQTYLKSREYLVKNLNLLKNLE